MKRSRINSEHLFIPALILSAGLHVTLLAGAGVIPSTVDFSILNAPNTPEFTVVSQPHVTVIEDDIITEEIINFNTSEKIVINAPDTVSLKHRNQKPVASPIESKGAITEAKPIMTANPAPLYPRLARQHGWEGTVRLNVLVQPDGRAQHIGIHKSSGHSSLDNAAVKAVGKWNFQPAQSGNMQFASKIIIPIQFKLLQE